ncbi:hypothetical protein BDR03DRAFT_855577, partial [Suillus americanus]
SKGCQAPILTFSFYSPKNIVAEGQTIHHIITWSYYDNVKEDSPEAIAAERKRRGWKSCDDSFVRALQVGDYITSWMRPVSRFPGWSNNVLKANITVYWAV